LPTDNVTVETPLGPAPGRTLGSDVVVVPVLRAGLGMLDAVLELVPSARVGHIGLQRDEMTAVASQYYSKLPPNLERSHVLIIDPMLATGGSAVAGLDLLAKAGANAIRMICIVAAPDGVSVVQQRHPNVEIYTPVVDRQLNEHKFIVPGLDELVLIQLAIDDGRIDFDVGVTLLNHRHAVRRGDDANHPDRVGAGLGEEIEPRHGAAAGCQHRVDDQHVTALEVRRE